MNHQYGCTVNTAVKKENRSSAALALVVGLVLAFSGTVVMATVRPIQGIPVGLEGDPGSIKVSTLTDKNGAFLFSKLPAGNYKLTLLPRGLTTSVSVGPNGIFGGKVMRASDGGISIFDRWGNLLAAPAPGTATRSSIDYNTSRSNIKGQ